MAEDPNGRLVEIIGIARAKETRAQVIRRARENCATAGYDVRAITTKADYPVERGHVYRFRVRVVATTERTRAVIGMVTEAAGG